eukprot:1111326-Rhodomonas_salina.1
MESREGSGKAVTGGSERGGRWKGQTWRERGWGDRSPIKPEREETETGLKVDEARTRLDLRAWATAAMPVGLGGCEEMNGGAKPCRGREKAEPQTRQA